MAVSLRERSGKSRLPLFLRQAYDFHQFELLGQPCLTMVETGNEIVSPATIRKQIDQLREKFSGDVIYVRLQLTSDLRRRLIEQGVQFVIPGNQLYLPQFGLDLREYFRTRPAESDMLTPAAQATLLYLLLHEDAPNRAVNSARRPYGERKRNCRCPTRPGRSWTCFPIRGPAAALNM